MRSAQLRKFRGRRGQALAEFVAAMLAVVVMLVGLIQISLLGKANVENIMRARGEADDMITANTAPTGGDDYISGWNDGADGLRYTADDDPSTGFGDLSTYSDELLLPQSLVDTMDSLGLSEYNEYSLPISTNTIIAAADLRRGVSRQTIPVERVLQKLVVRADHLTVKDEIFMPKLRLLGADN